MPSGIETRELLVGEGQVASRRSIATIRYEGKLGRGDRFGGGEETIDLGRRDAIPGRRYGIQEMHVGEAMDQGRRAAVPRGCRPGDGVQVSGLRDRRTLTRSPLDAFTMPSRLGARSRRLPVSA